MIARNLRNISFCVALLAASTASASEDIFGSLAGPGEKVLLGTGNQKDGSPGEQRMVRSVDGGIAVFEMTGRTTLESPKLNLECYYLNYDPARGVLEATDEVVIRQEGILAKSGRMVYNLETGEIVLTEEPYVEQMNEENRSVFQGMETFTIIQRETGGTEIKLAGGDVILCEVTPADKPEDTTATPTPTSTPVAAQPVSMPSGSGFAGLGDNVKIATRPRENQEPIVNISTTDTGEFEFFRSEGSVILESESMNLRADELEFDGTARVVEALYNVFIKQRGIEADCGRMLYELEKGRMELTVNPEIREQGADGSYTRLWDMASYTITRAQDGTVSTHSVAHSNIGSKTERISPPAPTPAGSVAPTEPVEIRLDSDEDLTRIGGTAPQQ